MIINNITPEQYKALYSSSLENRRKPECEVTKPISQKITGPLYTPFEKLTLGDDSWVGYLTCAFWCVTILGGILPVIAFFARENRLAECSKVTEAIQSMKVSDSNGDSTLNFMYFLGAEKAKEVADVINEFNIALDSPTLKNIFMELDIKYANSEIRILGDDQNYIAVKRGAVVGYDGIQTKELMSAEDFLITLQKHNPVAIEDFWNHGTDLTDLSLDGFKIPNENICSFSMTFDEKGFYVGR
ncbi:MAG: hypothetical protein K0R08_1165 [Solimicrobium sp.]|jgi:hypothetical protein|nr:hypothetical protein [Solimicrobium sp.]